MRKSVLWRKQSYIIMMLAEILQIDAYIRCQVSHTSFFLEKDGVRIEVVPVWKWLLS